MQQYGLNLHVDKCIWASDLVEFLGVNLFGKGLEPTGLSFPKPTSNPQIAQFDLFCGAILCQYNDTEQLVPFAWIWIIRIFRYVLKSKYRNESTYTYQFYIDDFHICVTDFLL